MKNQVNKKQLRNLIIIAGYYGFDNLGDEAILEQLLNELDSLGLKENTVVLSNNPEKTSAIYQVKSVNRWSWLAFIKLLVNAKILISGGGGLFQDRTGFGSVIFYSAQILFARLFNTKILIYAQGIGPLQTSFARELTHLAFRQANKITVRDPVSLSLITAWGLNGQLTADPVWSLARSPLPNASMQALEKIKSSADAKRLIVGLSLRNDPLLQSYHLEFLAQSLISNLPAGSIILLLPLQAQQDEQPLKTVEALLANSAVEVYYLDSSLLKKPSEWLELTDNCDLLIGMRFHALILCLKNCKPVVGITYDPKVSQLLEYFSQPALSLELNRDQSQTNWGETIESTLATRENLSRSIISKINQLKQEADMNVKILATVLEIQ